MRRREERRDRTRRAIADSALLLFIERGYEATTIQDIAAAARVSRSTVFRHFADKEELVFARDVDHLRELRRLLRQARPDVEDWTGLRNVMVAFARHLERDETLLARTRFVVANPRLFARSVALRMAWEDAVAEELAGWKEPSLRHRVVAATVVSGLFRAVQEWPESGGRLVPIVRQALGYITAPR